MFTYPPFLAVFFRQNNNWSKSRLYKVASKQWFLISAVLIIVLVFATRIWKVAEVPSGMYWDEAAIGYNGHAIWTTRRDEWLVKLPVSFKSFGDYKAPLAIYINGAFTRVFGMNIFAVRLPFVLSGVFASGMLMAVVALVFAGTKGEVKKRHHTRQLALFAGFSVLTTPWHFFFSRAGFESGLALSFLLIGMYFLMSILKNDEASFGARLLSRLQFLSKSRKVPTWWALFFAIISATAFVFAMYSYHSAKIVAPLLVFSTIVLFKNAVVKKWKPLLLMMILSGVLLLPMVIDTVSGKGAERLNQISIFASSSADTLPAKINLLTANLVTHLSPQFLLLGETTNLRQGDGRWGMLLLPQIILCLIALSTVFVRHNPHRKTILLSIVWIVIGLLPGAIGLDVPHSNRTLLSLPGFVLLSCVGLSYLFSLLDQTVERTWLGLRMQLVDLLNLIRIGIGMLLLVQGLLFLDFWHDYFTRYPEKSAEAFSYGYEQAMKYAISHEDTVDKILFTSAYGQPYIYALFFRETNPIWYQGGSLIKYEFSDSISDGDVHRKNTVIIATPEEVDPKFAQELVTSPDGNIRFVMLKTE